MKSAKLIGLSILIFAICNLQFAMPEGRAAAPTAQKARGPGPVSVTTLLDKTALWVGDALKYTIRVVHNSDIEFVADNLRREAFSLAPFIVREVSVREGKWMDNKKLLEITLTLTTYETGRSDLAIPPINLYYFKRAVGLEKREELAETVQVPAAKVGLRSTLGGGALRPRDSRPIASIDPWRALAASALGLAGMTYLTVLGARRARTALRRGGAKKRRLGRHARTQFVEENLARIAAVKGDSAEDPMRFYADLSQFLRRYLDLWLDIETAGLTPEEVEAALTKANVHGSLAQRIRTVLERCDLARYGKDGLGLDGRPRDELFTEVEKIVRSR